MSSIELPVSLGEALDKLTILDIKMGKIKDSRKVDVEKEYNVLYDKLKDYISKYIFYYNILKKINLAIWEMQDDFRDGNRNKVKLCFKIIEDNDRRFRVKKKINTLTNSSLKEQKGYKPKEAFVMTHQGLGDNITSIGMIRYLSTLYDKVVVACLNKNKANLEMFYKDDDSIELLSFNSDENISPNYGCDIDKFNSITEGYDLYMCGNHNLEKKLDMKNILIPECFYDQYNLPFSIFWEYFYIPEYEKYDDLYNTIKDIPYIFIHNSGSKGVVFDMDIVENKLNVCRNEILFINPCSNIYNNGDKFYDIASRFVGHKLPYYMKIIKNSTHNIVTDSSFMCLAINLEISHNNNFYISRGNRNYDHLYEKSFKKKYNKKEFKQIIL